MRAPSTLVRVAALASAVVASTLTGRVARADEPEALAAPESAPPRADASGVVDGRLGAVDDGIGDRFAAWAEDRFFAGPVAGGDTAVLLTDVGARFGLTSDSRVRFDWGVAYSRSHVAGSFATTEGDVAYDARVERVEPRNPELAFDWAPRIDSTRFSVGLGVALPVAAALNNPRTSEEAGLWASSTLTHERMLAMAGGLDPWRYRAERFALFLPISLLFPIDAMTISLAGGAGISVPVIGGGGGVTGDLFASVQLAGDVIPELRMGARIGLSVLDIGATPASGTSTGVQPSVTGWARIQLAPAFVLVTLLADVGGPYGLGGPNGVYALSLGGGAAL